MEVFVSWTGEDRDVKNVLIERLRKEKIECWDSDEYCTSDYSQECIEAIKKCEVFIVILSDASMKKGYVLNEVIKARNLENEGKLNILIYKITDAPLTEQFEFQLNHISFVSGNLIQRREQQAEGNIDLIVKRTKALLKKRMDGEPEKPFAVNIPKVEGHELSLTGYFVEDSRAETLGLIDEALNSSNVVVINELFGFGKRSTIRKYVEDHRDEYSTVTMLSNSYSSLREFFLLGLNFTNLNSKFFDDYEGDKLIDKKLEQLAKLDERTMLVIPDIKFERHPDRALCEKLRNLKCRIVLITQQSAEQYNDVFPVIRLGRMSNEHLLELFYHHYPQVYDEEREELDPHLEKFFDEMGGHTKTIELTASVLAHEIGAHPEEIPGYLSMNKRDGVELQDKIMDQISSLYQIEQPSDEETVALIVASLMAVPHISEQKFKDILSEFDITDWQVIKGLADKKWIDIDFKNRCISIEPLIARIVLKNNQNRYDVFAACFNYLYTTELERINIVASESSILISLLNRLEHILTSSGMEDMAEIPKYIKQYSATFDDESSELLRGAVENFEAKYEELLNGCEADDEYDDEYNNGEELYDFLNGMIETADGETEEEDNEEFDFGGFELVDDEASFDDIGRSFDDEFSEVLKEAFVKNAAACVSMLVPMAKLFSNKYYNWIANINGLDGASNSHFKLQDNPVEIGDFIGISSEDMKNILNSLSGEDDLDQESFEYKLHMEALVMYDYYTKKDFGMMMCHFNAVLDMICDAKELDSNSEALGLFFTLVGSIAKIQMLYTGNYHVALSLCERALETKVNVPERIIVVQAYIMALRNSGAYGDTLYDYYEECIKGFDSVLSKHIDKREDALSEKKKLYLDYAVDLAMGESFDGAVKNFEAALKLGRELIADHTVYSAKKIMNAFINCGLFDEAVEFVKKNFDGQALSVYEANCNAERETLFEIIDIISYSQMKEESNGDENSLEYEDYYHDFSRENNSLSEKKYYRIADKAMTYDFSDLFDEEIAEHAAKLLKKAKTMKIHDLAPEAFALVSEAGMRVLGYKHHYVQYVGAAAMSDGKIAEMLNGEGKTYTIPLVVFLGYLYGKKVIVTDSSQYLNQRNYQWMKGVYDLLGVDSMLLQSHIDLNLTNPKGEQYSVIYAYLNDIIFGYLRNEIKRASEMQPLRFDIAIIDEIDSVLVDSATQPYALNKEEYDGFKRFDLETAYRIAEAIGYDERYYSYNSCSVTLKSDIIPLIEEKFKLSYANLSNASRIKKIESYIASAILCCFYYDEDKDYFIAGGRPVGEDKRKGVFYNLAVENTYFLCRKHGLDINLLGNALNNNVIPLNYICIRDFFKKFKTICGTTATAVSFKKEFMDVYDLDYVPIPPARPIKRHDYLSPLYMNERTKRKAVIDKVIEKHGSGQPILLITEDIAESEFFSRALARRGVENIVLNAKNSDDCVDIIAQAGVLGSVMISTNIVNRGVDIVLGGNPQLTTRKELVNMGVDVTGLDDMLYSLPDEKTLRSELYKKYKSVYEKNRAFATKNKQAVISVGGLCVIGTCFFDEPRVEQQMRGRAGRQGEIGESWVFRSIDDSLLRQLLPEGHISMMKSSMGSDEAISTGFLDKAIKNARQKLHERKFNRIKYHNAASKYVDDARPEFTGRRENLKKDFSTVDDILLGWVRSREIHKLITKLQKGEKAEGSGLLNRLYEKNPAGINSLRGLGLEKALLKMVKDELTEHFERLGRPDPDFISECVDAMVGNAFGSYVKVVNDAYNDVSMNEKLLDKYLEEQKNIILLDMVEKIFNIRLKTPSPFVVKRKNSDKRIIGPNDPCPCGSGKKYKKCCGEKE